MTERIRWLTSYVQAECAVSNPGCTYHDRVDDPGPDGQKALIRRARQHALRTGHRVSIERGQIAGVQP